MKIFPRINVTDFEHFGRGAFSNEPTNTWTVQPNVSMQKGPHSLRFADGRVLSRATSRRG